MYAFVLSLIHAIKGIKHCIVRSVASFVKVFGNFDDKPILEKEDVMKACVKNGGIILVVSRVKKTVVHLEKLLTLQYVHPIEFNQHCVLEENGLIDEASKTTKRAEELIKKAGRCGLYQTRAV